MRMGRGDGPLRTFLPGSDADIGNFTALSYYLAPGKGISGQAWAQEVHRQIYDL